MLMGINRASLFMGSPRGSFFLAISVLHIFGYEYPNISYSLKTASNLAQHATSVTIHKITPIALSLSLLSLLTINDYEYCSPTMMSNSLVFLFSAVLLPAAHAQFNLPFDVPQWLMPADNGGKLPFLPTDQLSVVECPASTLEASKCDLFGEGAGVFVCRRVGLVPLSICTPNVMATGNATVLGLDSDTCGCCGEECPQICPCDCNDGRGVMMETNITRWWPMTRCISRTIADYLSPLRSEIRCDTSCLPEQTGVAGNRGKKDPKGN